MDFLYPLAFWLFAALIAVSAIAMVVTQNIVRAATWLLFTLAGVAGIFFLLGADFVGATQLLVYVGGTLVLVVFGVMLTAQGPFINLKIGAGEWAIAAAVGLGFFSVLAYVLVGFEPKVPANVAVRQAPHKAEQPLAVGAAAGSLPLADNPETRSYHSLASAAVLGEALLGFEKTAPDSPVTGVRDIVTVGPGGTSSQVKIVKERTKMAYLLPFEIVSLHLLVVLIGAAYLARSKRRRGATS